MSVLNKYLLTYLERSWLYTPEGHAQIHIHTHTHNTHPPFSIISLSPSKGGALSTKPIPLLQTPGSQTLVTALFQSMISFLSCFFKAQIPFKKVLENYTFMEQIIYKLTALQTFEELCVLRWSSAAGTSPNKAQSCSHCSLLQRASFSLPSPRGAPPVTSEGEHSAACVQVAQLSGLWSHHLQNEEVVIIIPRPQCYFGGKNPKQTGV